MKASTNRISKDDNVGLRSSARRLCYNFATKQASQRWKLFSFMRYSQGGNRVLRQCKYLNNLIEQDHRFIKRRVNAGLGFFSFKTAGRTIKGYEAMQMVRKGQIEGVAKGDVEGQLRFVESLFKVAA